MGILQLKPVPREKEEYYKQIDPFIYSQMIKIVLPSFGKFFLYQKPKNRAPNEHIQLRETIMSLRLSCFQS